MSSSSGPEARPVPVPEGGAVNAALVPHPCGGLRLVAAGAALVAGVAAWLVAEGLLIAYHGRLHPPLPAFPPPSLTFGIWAAEKEVAALAAAALGALLGLALGLAGGLARRSAASAVRGGLAGLVVGAAAGGAVAFGLVGVYQANYNPRTEDLLLSLVTHAGIAAAIGAVAGAALGLGLRFRVGAALVGGLLGALVGAVLYELIGALALPAARTGAPMAAAMGPRLLLPVLIAVPAALGAAWAVLNPATRKPNAKTPPAA